ncbi:hypothetical protein AXX17_AT4G04370 [Arabidopsis thaliana]|uniref:Uncharacterized protein n=2 Tax=Arabidopsis TaxID=3701 RepID=A0A178UYT7_ARATH|nr:hypothetical protein AXX17_AT4G04410 [Arabidopsis thaliana]OAO99159.1 hypothetical protein AXX17_AT4G04370 [Arabidopsis thaliana]
MWVDFRFEMDISEARLDRIEVQSSVDASHDQLRKIYVLMNKIYNCFRSLSSRGFFRAGVEATPQPMEDTEPVPEFFISLRLSDLCDLPGEYVLMKTEMLSTLSDGNEEWLETLRSHGTPLACLKNDQGDSILHLAATWGNLELVKSIVSECPCLLLELNSKDQLPLHVAALTGHPAVVEDLVASVTFSSARLAEEDREILNPYILKDINGDTALNLALKGHYTEVALCLVNANQQASFLACKDRISPLYLAVEAGNVLLVKAMLGNDGPEGRNSNVESLFVDERDEEGRTCLSFGASIGYHKGVRNLLDRSRKGVYVCDDDGSYPIHVAAEKGHIEVVKEICKRCPVSTHLRNRKDQNILHIAADRGRFRLLRQWRNHEHLANEKDVGGNTPLHLATIKWRPRAVQFLAVRKNLLIQN